MTKPKPPRATVDWDKIEREYRLGRFSIRELAKRHGVAHPTILRHAARGGWIADKAPEVDRRVKERLLLGAPHASTRPERTSSEPGGTYQGKRPSAPRAEVTEEDIAAVVDDRVSIHVAHQNMGRDFRAILMSLVEELRVTTAQLDEIRGDIVADTEGETDGARRARMMRAVSLPSRVTSAASIISSGKNIQWIERLANNLAPALAEGAAEDAPRLIEIVIVDP